MEEMGFTHGTDLVPAMSPACTKWGWDFFRNFCGLRLLKAI